MKFKKTTTILLALSLLLATILIPCSVSANPQTYINSYLSEKLEKNNLSGVIYVTKNGEVLGEAARGMKNAEEEITTDTLFPIGSNSKQFCAVAVLLLQEQGKLSVDNKISEYFPEYTKTKDATIKNLLTMRAGIPDHTNVGLINGEYALSATATKEENQQTILNWLYEKELDFAPDTDFNYTNTSYFLLSMIVEKVSGQSYSDYVKENILVPLKLDNTGFYEELLTHPDLAQHNVPTDKPIDPELKGLTQGCGDLVSNAKDMDKWMTSLKECTLLSEESITEMTTSYTPDSGYGYGLVVYDDGSLYHNGGIVCYLSVTLTYPEEGLNFFIISSDYNTGSPYVVDRITSEIDKDLAVNRTFGDVNGDDKITVKDATLIQKSSAKISKLSAVELICGDVNEDDKVNVKDATAIQKHVAKIDTKLPFGELIY